MSEYDDIIDLPRPPSKYPKMSVSNRAKIFAPFAALKGYDSAIREKDIVYEEKRPLSEDQEKHIDDVITSLKYDDLISVTHFIPEKTDGQISVGRYITESGRFRKVDTVTKRLYLSDSYIRFTDIYEISSVEEEIK